MSSDGPLLFLVSINFLTDPEELKNIAKISKTRWILDAFAFSILD